MTNCTQAKFAHMNFTSISREIHMKNFTWDSPQSSLYMKLTWKFLCEYHVNWDSHESDVKIFTWISREIYNNKKLIFFMILIKFENLDVIWITLF